MQLYALLSPQEAAALPRNVRPVHMAWRLSKQGQLLRLPLPGSLRRGILGLSDLGMPASFSPQLPARQLLQQCRMLELGGVLADFEAPPGESRLALLQSYLQERSGALSLFVPESYRAAEGTCVLCSTAISGGRLQQRLEEAREVLGPGRFALYLPRLAMDFTLPAPSGTGTPLSAEALQQLREQHRASVFYSPELMARYFTYRRGEDFHFALFDDAGTLHQKLQLGKKLGARAAFLLYPQVRDCLAQLVQGL